MLKLKLQYFGYLIQRVNSLEKTQRLGKMKAKGEGAAKDEMVNSITNSMENSLSKFWEWWWTGKPGMLQSMGSQRVRHDWVTELNWREHLLAEVSVIMPHLTIIIIISGIIPILQNELNKALYGQVMQNGREYEVKCINDQLVSSMSVVHRLNRKTPFYW